MAAVILAIETAYDVCGAALLDESGDLTWEEKVVPRAHNEHLALMVKKLMDDRQIEFGALDNIAVSAGPGSFTGLRVGMSYAKGLAFAAGTAIIPVPTLPSLLEGEEVEPPLWVAAWSHRNQLYALHVDRDGNWGNPSAMGWNELMLVASEQLVVGYGLSRFTRSGFELSGALRSRMVETCPSAVKVAKLAIRAALSPVEDLANLAPEYHYAFAPSPVISTRQ